MKDMVQVKRQGGQRHKTPEAKIGRSQFNRSHGLKTSFDASYLYPIFVDDVLPGDTMTCKLNGFCRVFSPLDAPLMDNIELETFFFFVPNRIVWSRWVDFQGEHEGAGAQDTTYTVPVMADGITVDHDGGTACLDLMAYFGIPDGLSTTAEPVSALPMRGYNRIFSEWFRDQNLDAIATLHVDDGPDAASSYNIEKSSKKHDYFTSCLPYLQKGTAIAYAADVVGDTAGAAGLGRPEFQASDSTPASGGYLRAVSTATIPDVEIEGDWTVTEHLHWQDPELVANIDINALRLNVAIQRLLERDARGGTRYVELIKSHFGVTSPDFRLQRPEYLGGGKAFINVSPVANTSDTAGVEQGELKGVGTGVIQGHGWAKSFTEHGYIIGLIRARAELTYFQGLDRHWSKSTRYDFYIPALAQIGEQSVLNKELFLDGTSNDDTVFGYQERWSEYRMKQSKITGLFNPDAASALSHWHLAEDFGSQPALNTTFMNDNSVVTMDRVTTIDVGPQFVMDLWFDYKCARPIPVFSVPSLTERF